MLEKIGAVVEVAEQRHAVVEVVVGLGGAFGHIGVVVIYLAFIAVKRTDRMVLSDFFRGDIEIQMPLDIGQQVLGVLGLIVVPR